MEAWRAQLIESPFVSQPGADSLAPLVLDGDRLYLARYWHYECQVARALLHKAVTEHVADPVLVRSQLEALFVEPDPEGEINWQKVACALAVQRRLLVLTGGPGTGKTTTVIRLLALLLQQAASPQDLVIRLAAPTGKAAVRMTESIRRAKTNLALEEDLKELIPEDASTLHRLLGTRPNSVAFRHDRHNPLRLDLLILDEASMVDLPMMAKLLEALPDHCRLIILGDKDQLSSVEAGSVLGDLCQSIRYTEQGALMHYEPNTLQALEAMTGMDLHQHGQPGPLIGNIICMLQ